MCTLSNINITQCVLLFLVLVGNSALFQFLRSLHALTLVALSYALLALYIWEHHTVWCIQGE